MTKQTEVNYPIYIYVEKHGKGKYQYYTGDFCKGRNPTSKELKTLAKRGNLDKIRNSAIEWLRNPLHNTESNKQKSNYKTIFSFLSLESLIKEAIATYTKKEYTSGLILGYNDTPLPDRVLVIGNGNNKTETEFLKHAQNNNMWA